MAAAAQDALHRDLRDRGYGTSVLPLCCCLVPGPSGRPRLLSAQRAVHSSELGALSVRRRRPLRGRRLTACSGPPSTGKSSRRGFSLWRRQERRLAGLRRRRSAFLAFRGELCRCPEGDCMVSRRWRGLTEGYCIFAGLRRQVGRGGWGWLRPWPPRQPLPRGIGGLLFRRCASLCLSVPLTAACAASMRPCIAQATPLRSQELTVAPHPRTPAANGALSAAAACRGVSGSCSRGGRAAA